MCVRGRNEGWREVVGFCALLPIFLRERPVGEFMWGSTKYASRPVSKAAVVLFLYTGRSRRWQRVSWFSSSDVFWMEVL